MSSEADVVPGPWVISARGDLFWLMGGTLASAALLAAWSAWRFDFSLVWLAWIALSNGPHLFATYSRTYFSAPGRGEQAGLLSRSLLLFAIGPVALLACVALSRLQLVSMRGAFLGYQLAVYLWAYWHTVRQHYGVLRLYQRHSQADRLEPALIHVGLVAPFIAYLVRHPDVRVTLGLPAQSGADAWVLAGLAAVTMTLAGIYAWRQLERLRKREPVSVPRVLFVAAMLVFYSAMCTHPLVLQLPLYAIAPLLILPHDLQYHALVRFFHVNHEVPPLKRGLFLGAALLLGAGIATLGCSLDEALVCSSLFDSSSSVLLPELTWRHWATAAFHGFFLHHYYLDQHIWRPSAQPWVAKGLRA